MSLCQQPALVPVFHLTDRKKGGSQRSSSPKTLKMSMAELAPAASHTEGVLTFKKLYQEQQKVWRMLSRVAVCGSFCLFRPYDWCQGEKGLNFLMSNRKPFAGWDINLRISTLSYCTETLLREFMSEASTGSWNCFENDQLIQKH